MLADLRARAETHAQLIGRLDEKIRRLQSARDERARGLINLRAAIDRRSAGLGSYDHDRPV